MRTISCRTGLDGKSTGVYKRILEAVKVGFQIRSLHIELRAHDKKRLDSDMRHEVQASDLSERVVVNYPRLLDSGSYSNRAHRGRHS